MKPLTVLSLSTFFFHWHFLHCVVGTQIRVEPHSDSSDDEQWFVSQALHEMLLPPNNMILWQFQETSRIHARYVQLYLDLPPIPTPRIPLDLIIFSSYLCMFQVFLFFFIMVLNDWTVEKKYSKLWFTILCSLGCIHCEFSRAAEINRALWPPIYLFITLFMETFFTRRFCKLCTSAILFFCSFFGFHCNRLYQCAVNL